jgi:predicted short-subunit dehydrogenase-like oxidoreductase (DUF2520 family)
VVVGFGRVGGALSLGLKRAGWPVTVFPRSGESLRRAVSLGAPIADLEALGEASVCLLAVPDSAVTEVAQQMLPDLGLTTSLVHCAGALDLSVFGSEPRVLRRMRGSFHPLAAISDPEDPLQGHTVALSATGRPLMKTLRRMAEELGLSAIEVSESGRAAYHAGAVLAAGGLVSLLSAAVEALGQAGVGEEEALRALLQLSRSALRGVEVRGLESGLTGPVRRGDVDVVKRHLKVLPEELAGIYRDLSLRALELCGRELSPEARSALEQLLSR